MRQCPSRSSRPECLKRARHRPKGGGPQQTAHGRTRRSSHSLGKCIPPKGGTQPSTAPGPQPESQAIRLTGPGHTPGQRRCSESPKHQPTPETASQPQHITPQRLPNRALRSSRTAQKSITEIRPSAHDLRADMASTHVTGQDNRGRPPGWLSVRRCGPRRTRQGS